MIDESEEGNVFAALRMREADLDKHLVNPNGGDEAPKSNKPAAPAQQGNQQAPAKPAAKNGDNGDNGKPVDTQLDQALNVLKVQLILQKKNPS